MGHKAHYLIVFLLLLFVPSVVALEEPFVTRITESYGQLTILSIFPEAIEASFGQVFIVNIVISSVSDLYGWEFKLKWNSTLLDANNIIEGALLQSSGNTFFTYKINNTAGYMMVDCTVLGDVLGVDGDGTLAVVAFYVKGIGQCPLDLYDTLLVSYNETLISHQAVDSYAVLTMATTPASWGASGPPRPPRLR